MDDERFLKRRRTAIGSFTMLMPPAVRVEFNEEALLLGIPTAEYIRRLHYAHRQDRLRQAAIKNNRILEPGVPIVQIPLVLPKPILPGDPDYDPVWDDPNYEPPEPVTEDPADGSQ